MEKLIRDKYGRVILNSTPFVYYDVVNKSPDPNGGYSMITYVVARFFSEEKAKEYLKKLNDRGYSFNSEVKIAKRVVKEYFYVDVDEKLEEKQNK